MSQSQGSNELPFTPLTDNYAAGLDDPRVETEPGIPPLEGKLNNTSY